MRVQRQIWFDNDVSAMILIWTWILSHKYVTYWYYSETKDDKKEKKSYDSSSEIVYMLVRQINSRTTITSMNLYKTNWGEHFENISSKCKHSFIGTNIII